MKRNWFAFLLWLRTCLCVPQEIPVYYKNIQESARGSYNSFVHQVGYCKMQGYDTSDRANSRGPSIFVDGQVMIGVGVSHSQFGEGKSKNWMGINDGGVLCGMCLEVLAIENMPLLDSSLTTWNYSMIQTTPFKAMVFDQCNDPVCTSGYLDFDIYSEIQPVKNGNPVQIQWRAIDCPVEDSHGQIIHFIELLFCSPSTCNKDDPDVSAWRDAFNPKFFGLVVRNSRIPIIAVTLQDPTTKERIHLEYYDAFGWTWDEKVSGLTYDLNRSDAFHLEITSFDGQKKNTMIRHEDILDRSSTPGYRGGILYTTDIQFDRSSV